MRVVGRGMFGREIWRMARRRSLDAGKAGIMTTAALRGREQHAITRGMAERRSLIQLIISSPVFVSD